MPTQPSICVATHHASINELLSDAEFRSLANRDGFLIELRLDFFDDLSDESFQLALDVFAPNLVVTFRHPLEGGKRPDASDAERLRYLQAAAHHGVKYIDIEARTRRERFDKRASNLILSYHDFEKVPDYATLIQNIWLPMCRQKDVDLVKIALMPKTIDDTVPALQLMRAAQRMRLADHGGNVPNQCETLVLCMAEAGLWSRVLAGYFGAPFTFARGEDASGTAPGQLTWRDLESIYRFREIKDSWHFFGVIGDPVGHSLSPLMHNAAFAELGLRYAYLPFKVEGDPRNFLESFGFLLRGVSVTIPHKEPVMKCCATVEPAAQSIGAVNTLKVIPRGNDDIFNRRDWSGSNTDAAAAADCLEAALGSLSGKHVLVLGAGGAARAVVVGVKERGATVSILNRTHERAQSLAKELGATAVTHDDLPNLNLDAIVNTTSLGMHPNVDTSPLEEKQIPQGGLVFDTVYNPLRTRLLELAEKRGCKTVEGVEMFIRQGVRQFELWTGKKAPREVMERVVLEALKKRQK